MTTDDGLKLTPESHCPKCGMWPLRLYRDGVWACDECGWMLPAPTAATPRPGAEQADE